MGAHLTLTRRHGGNRRIKPSFDGLEARIAPATYYPTPTDAGLRAAIAEAEHDSDAIDTIYLNQSGPIPLSDTAAGPLVIQNLSSQSVKRLTFIGGGEGGSGITVSGQDTWSSRILDILGTNLWVDFEEMSITGGHAEDSGPIGGPDALGGAMLIVGAKVSLTNVSMLQDNAFGSPGETGAAATAPDESPGAGTPGAGAWGGAIYLDGGNLSLDHCDLFDDAANGGPGGTGGQPFSLANAYGPGGNGADAGGGALFVQSGTVSVFDSAITGTVTPGRGGDGGSESNGGNGFGGGVDLEGGTLIAVGSSLGDADGSGPNAGADARGKGGDFSGGAAYVGGGALILIHATISNAQAVGGLGADAGNAYGGGVAVSSGSLSLLDTSVTNCAAIGGPGTPGEPGVDAGFGGNPGPDDTDGGPGRTGGNAAGGAIWFGSGEYSDLGGNTIQGMAEPGAGGPGGPGGFAAPGGTDGATGPEGAPGMKGADDIDGSPGAPGPAVELSVLNQPPGNSIIANQVLAGVPFGMSVMALDSEGAVAKGFSGTVNVALANNPHDAVLSGDTNVSAVNGIATFSSLQIDLGGVPTTLQATSESFIARTSPLIVIGYTPAQIRHAYGIDQLPYNGQGQVIAVVIPYDDPSLLNGSDPNFPTSDLGIFDRTFGLPDPPGFAKINQDGLSEPLPALSPDPGYWQLEAALDVEWAHAVAPQAQVVLVEANSDSTDDVIQAVRTAASLQNVSVVSLSLGLFGGSEDLSETALDSAFTTPAGHLGVTFVAASGDDGGSAPWYPAMSPNVVAVGGTTLRLNADNTYASETAWANSGGGPSEFESEPLYQEAVQSTGRRTTPDVAFDADGATGVGIYDNFSIATTGTGWTVASGTSIGTPAWAGLFALVNQGRVQSALPSLDGPSQTLPALYALPSADFHDVTSGSNGPHDAAPGYDFATGLGSPQANLLVPDLVKYGAPTGDHFVVTSGLPSGSIVAGTPLGLTVELVNAQGAVDAQFNGLVSARISGGANVGTSVSAYARAGIAALPVLRILVAARGYSVQLLAAGTPAFASNPFNVVAGPARSLVFLSQPPMIVSAGGKFGVALGAVDAYGNPSILPKVNVTLALGNNPGGDVLRGKLKVKAAGGVARFAGLSLKKPAQGYTIVASAPGLSPRGSGGITVVSRTPPHKRPR